MTRKSRSEPGAWSDPWAWGKSAPDLELFTELRYPTPPLIQDTDTPELAARSDRLASDIGRRIRPGIRTNATVSSVWLVWERQHPTPVPRYTFERVHQLHLGQS
ncbi:hypothetical protein [Kitasatospora sp. NPDC001095]